MKNEINKKYTDPVGKSVPRIDGRGMVTGQAKYAFYDENTAGRMLSVADLPADLSGVEALFFGGISLAVEPCAETYAALCMRSATALPVMVDPNIRPGFIADEARFRARMDRLLAHRGTRS